MSRSFRISSPCVWPAVSDPAASGGLELGAAGANVIGCQRRTIPGVESEATPTSGRLKRPQAISRSWRNASPRCRRVMHHEVAMQIVASREPALRREVIVDPLPEEFNLGACPVRIGRWRHLIGGVGGFCAGDDPAYLGLHLVVVCQV